MSLETKLLNKLATQETIKDYPGNESQRVGRNPIAPDVLCSLCSTGFV